MADRHAKTRRPSAWRGFAWALLWLTACRGGPAPRDVDPAWVALELGGDTPLDSPRLRVQPQDAVSESRFGPGRTLHVQVKRLPFRLQLTGFCSVQVESLDAPPALTPLWTLPSIRADVGFDAPVTLRAEPGCEQARRGHVRFEQTQGPEVTLTPSADGMAVELRTPKAPASLSDLSAKGAHGLVPVSAGEQQRLGFAMHYTGEDGESLTRHVHVLPAARATGLPTVSMGQRYFLRGAGWRVTVRPPRSVAEPAAREGSPLTTFTPDRSGRYALRDDDGCELRLHAGAHAEVPLDCGRAPCHAESSGAADRSPMTHALDSFAVSAFGQSQGCVPDCHFAGQAGIDDGGFVATAGELAFRPLQALKREALPAALQRLAGVGCTSCHGPAAIPPEEGRARIVSSDVCASCHDLPAPLDVVARWSAGAMARADAAPESRQGDCAQCHTTLGFLHRIGVRPQPRPASSMGRRGIEAAAAAPRTEQADGHTGIACAACHAVHAEGAAPGARLLRAVTRDAPTRDDAIQALCGTCHAPLSEEARPSASAASLVSGQAEAPGRPVEGAAPHGGLPGACTACHGQLSATAKGEASGSWGHGDVRPALDHAFGVRDGRCGDCHDAGVVERTARAQRELEARAQSLSGRLSRRCGEAVDHGHPRATRPLPCDAPNASRAAYLLDLVRRDGAAAAHNLPFARQLLDDAEGALAAP